MGGARIPLLSMALVSIAFVSIALLSIALVRIALVSIAFASIASLPVSLRDARARVGGVRIPLGRTLHSPSSGVAV